MVAGALSELFDGRSVVGLGDGRGEYRRLILKDGRVTRYDAYDGSPNINNITGGQVRPSYFHHLFAATTHSLEARYCLFVLKVPLNPKQASNQHEGRAKQKKPVNDD